MGGWGGKLTWEGGGVNWHGRVGGGGIGTSCSTYYCISKYWEGKYGWSASNGGVGGRHLACLHIQDLLDWEDDVFDLRYTVVLQDLSVGHGDVDTGHADCRGIQVVEGWAWKQDRSLLNINLRMTCLCVFLNSHNSQKNTHPCMYSYN